MSIGGGVHSFTDLLRTSKADLTPGLNEAEFRQIEERYDVSFGALHRAFLGEVLPLAWEFHALAGCEVVGNAKVPVRQGMMEVLEVS